MADDRHLTRGVESIENGFLTPTMKIKRSRIEAAVEDRMAISDQSGQTMVWA